MRFLLLLTVFALLSALPARAADVLILQSSRTAACADALRGFHATNPGSYRTVVISDYALLDVQQIVQEERPRLVLAVGDQALSAARKLRGVPVVSMLSLSLCLQKQHSDNIGGIGMAAAPEQYLALFARLGLKRVGVLYDPAKSDGYLKRMVREAQQSGVNLVVVPVTSANQIQAKLGKLRGNVDALWVLPDSTVATAVNIEAFLVFSMSFKVPVVTFSRQYLSSGAAASLDLDFYDIGRQAGEMAASLLFGAARKVPTLDPRKTYLHTNDKVLLKTHG